ncbi:MAG: hypothetical protein ABGY72_02740 [bacterium]
MRQRLRRRGMTSVIDVLTILLVGCEFARESEHTPLAPLAPSDVTISPVLLGSWSFSAAASSTGVGLPSAESCTDLQFTFDEQQGDTYTGTFSATCADGIVLTGSATGTYVNGLVTVTADGLATSGGVQCSFTLNGTARVVGEQIEIDYSGTSCLGPVSGSQVLTR